MKSEIKTQMLEMIDHAIENFNEEELLELAELMGLFIYDNSSDIVWLDSIKKDYSSIDKIERLKRLFD